MTSDADKFMDQYFADHPKMHVQREGWVRDAIQAALDHGCTDKEEYPIEFQCTCGARWHMDVAGPGRFGYRNIRGKHE